MKKKLIGGIVAIAVLAIGATVFFGLFGLNGFLKGAIEDHGSDATATSVQVSKVDVALTEGRGSIKGLSIASPDGFKAREAFALGDITVDIDVSSVRKDPVVIDLIRIAAPVVNAEFNKSGESNIDRIRKSVQSFVPASSSDAGSDGDKDAKRIRIKSFVFEKGRIELDASELGVEKRSVDLPELRLSDIGGANGATPDQLAKEILSAVSKNVVSQIARSEIKDRIGDTVKDKASDLLKKVTN